MSKSRNVQVSTDEMAGLVAEEEYLRAGNTQPAFGRMYGLLEGMRRAKDTPKRGLLLAGVHIDVATSAETDQAVASYHLHEAERLVDRISSRDQLETLPVDQYRFALKARLLEAYLPIYRKKLVGDVEPSTEDDAKILAKLLAVAGVTFVPANISPDNGNTRDAVLAIKGMQFELGMHILNARANLHSEDRLYLWPSLPRQDSPHTYDFSRREGVDALISDCGMFDADATRLQLKSVGEVDDYDPEIVTIVGKDDLGTRFSAEIAQLAYSEAYPLNDREKAGASKRLDEFEARFMSKLENASQNVSLQN